MRFLILGVGRSTGQTTNKACSSHDRAGGEGLPRHWPIQTSKSIGDHRSVARMDSTIPDCKSHSSLMPSAGYQMQKNLSLSATFAAAIIFPGIAHADCRTTMENLQNHISKADIVMAGQSVETIATSRECGPDEKRQAKRLYGNALVDAAQRATADPAQAAKLVETAAALNASWRASVAFGNLLLNRKDYSRAAQVFMGGLELVEADVAEFEETGADNPAKAAQSDITYLVARADEARQLAAASPNGVLVASPISRNGLAGGVFSSVTQRGAEAFKVPVPIIFKYDSAEFTPVGQSAADELVRVLKERSPKSVTVVGHTDMKGSNDYNLPLSQRRAEKVGLYLKANGIASNIRTVGKGKSEPRRLSDPSSFSSEQIDELNRRVEIDWAE